VHKHGKEERNMKNFKTKLLALVLVLATALGSAPLAVQAAVSAPSEATYYLTSKDDTSYGNIYISGLSKSSKVTKIKSSKKSVATLNSYQKSTYSNSSTTKYLDSNEADYTSSYKEYSANIGFFLNKAGTSDITYTIGKKSYTTKITVKDYTNPLKTVEISGLKNGKSSNLKGLVDSSAYASPLSLKSEQKDAKIKLATEKNWKITYAELFDNETSTALEMYNYSTGLSSVTLRPGTLNKGGNYSLYIYMYNEEDGGTLNITYSIN
jgi:hypothetical protein